MPRPIEHEQFEQLYSQHGRAVFAHIRTLVPSQQDAEEVFQETSTTLWSKFDQYQPGTDFRAWACRIAYYKVLKLRERKHRARRLFSSEFVEAVDEEMIVMSDTLDARSEALRQCRQQLKRPDRELLDDYYTREVKVAEIAARLRRSVHSIYRALRRIHDRLHDCIERRLGGEA